VAILREVEPAESPQYWLPDIAGSAFVQQIQTPSLEQARSGWSPLNYPAFGLHSHDLGIGVRRPEGIGDTRRVAGVPRPVLGIEPSIPLVRTRSFAFLDQTPAVREAYERIAAGGGIPNLPHEAFDLDILDEPPDAILLIDGGWDAGFVACYRLLRTQSAELPEVFVDEGSTVGRQAWPLTFEIPLIERLDHLFMRISFPLYSVR